MKQISIPFNNFKMNKRLHRRMNVESDYSGQLLRDGEVVGYKVASNPVGRVIFKLYR